MGFVLVQHLDPAQPSTLTHILSKATSMPVQTAADGLRVMPNQVYVIPPNAYLLIKDGTLQLQVREHAPGPQHAIDTFFESLAQDRREQAIGVILSGTGSDGTRGLEAIKATDGIVLVQDASAKYDSMPRSAIAARCVDFVLSPEGIAQELARIGRHPYVAGGHPIADNSEHPAATDTPLAGGGSRALRADAQAGPDSTAANEIHKILVLLHNHSGTDFSLYKSPTIQRRIARRIVLNRMNTLEAYARFLRGNTKEIDLLYTDMLISVTEFFRNPKVFEALQREVFPKLIRSRRNEWLRVWVPGCSSGQEAYSLAMAFAEVSERAGHGLMLQMFATDLNEGLIDKARAGLYPKSIAQDVSPERLRRFFIEKEGGYCIAKALRERIVFARHNLLRDPPFARMNLISCRNLLIYLEPNVQQKLLSTFHYALKPNGFLFLGASESIAASADLFQPVDKKFRLYAKKPRAASPRPLSSSGSHLVGDRQWPKFEPGVSQPAAAPPRVALPELNAQREADRVTVKRFAPPGVLINANLDILQFRGATSPYLEPPSSKVSFNVLNMAREELMLPLRAVINEAKKENKVVRKEHMEIIHNGRAHAVNIEVIPLKNLKERHYLILFEAATKGHARRNATEAADDPQGQRPQALRPGKPEDTRRIARLERELAEARDYAQALQEQYEAANEELQASGEEVESANEELQSTNEELETSKEEVESTNEELTTVNEELRHRNAELTRLNDDLNNLQESVNLPVLIVTRALTIRSFNPLAEKRFNLGAADASRPVGAIKSALHCPDLEQLIANVIDTVSMKEHEVRDHDGRWHLMRIRPYKTLDHKIDGVVLVLVSIDALKRSELDAKHARNYAQATLRAARDPLLILTDDLRVHTANDAFYKTFTLSPGQVEGRSIFEVGGGTWNIPQLRALLMDILPRNNVFNDFEVVHELPGSGRRTMLLHARRMGEDVGLEMVVLGIEDVTERMESREAVQRSEIRFRRLFETAQDGILMLDADSGTITDANPFVTRLLGYPHEELIGKALWQIGLLQDEAASQAALRELQDSGCIRYDDLPLQGKDGRSHAVEFVSNVYEEDGKKVIQYNIRDITVRKRADDALRESEARFHAIADNVPVMIWIRGADQCVTYLNKSGLKFIGINHDQDRNQRWHAAIHPDDLAHSLDTYTKAFKKHERFESEYRLRRNDGEYRSILDVGIPLKPDGEFTGYIGSCVDVTEQKHAEHELSKSSKLESVGALAAGIAHDFNNLLTSIVGNIGLVKLSLDTDGELFKGLTEAEHAGLRARDLAQQLLIFAHGGAPIQSVISLAGLLEEWITFALRGSNIKFTSAIAPELWPVYVDVGQLGQVINNIIINAQQAMPQGGAIRVTADNVTFGMDAGLPIAGDCVRIAIQDQGPGVAEEYLSKIFDPFFTTKPKGTGLGLATSYAIIKKHGGHLTVQSKLGHGATFFIYLLASHEDVSPKSNEVSAPPVHPGKVLFMDDDPSIRNFVSKALAHFGYEVACVEDGRVAIEQYRLAMEQGEPYDGVILDLTVPGGMGGSETMRALRELDPKVKAIVSSGYSNDKIMADFRTFGFCARIIKPYQIDELRTVASLLQGKTDKQ